jgi:hypothetical protein
MSEAPPFRRVAALARGYLDACAGNAGMSLRLREHGLVLCQDLSVGSHRDFGGASKTVVGPAVMDIVDMPREALIRWCNGAAIEGLVHRQRYSPRDLDRTLGALALSYARDSDMVVVCALVRMAAAAGVHGSWLGRAVEFLLRQQHLDGSFSADTEPAKAAVGAGLVVTVDVLQTLHGLLQLALAPGTSLARQTATSA